MKAFLLMALAGAALFAPLPASAQDAASDDPLDAYRADELALDFSMMRGWRVTRAGLDLDLGYLGKGADSIFAGSDEALASMRTYRQMRTGGFVMNMIGVAALTAELVTLLVARDLFFDSGGDTSPLFFAWLIPPTVVGMTGGIIMQAALTPLCRAVRQYNDDLASSVRGDGSVDVEVGLMVQGRFR